MKTISLILTLAIFSTVPLFGQVDKYTDKLNALYNERKFEEVKKYKNKKLESLASMSLFFKAMAYYMTEDDKNSLKYFDLAIAKGPVDHDMYYYRGMTLFYTKKYPEALISLDKAIELLATEPAFYASKGEVYLQMEDNEAALTAFWKAAEFEDCGPGVYESIANIYSAQKEYNKAISAFKSALELHEPKSNGHKNCSYNIGLSQQMAGNFEESEKSFDQHISDYPDDYASISKLIQIYYASDQVEKVQKYKDKMIGAYHSNRLPDHLKKMYCIDQFEWSETRVLVFESYEKYEAEVVTWKHKFFIQDEKGDIDYKLYTVLDSTNESKEAPDTYQLVLIKNDTASTYDNFSEGDSSDYSKLRKAVQDILNKKVQPVSQFPEYDKWLDAEYDKRSSISGLEFSGTSFEKAVKAKSVAWEYEWLRQYYPGSKFLQQALRFNEGIPYDVLSIKTKSGKSKDVYFDISSFFGKGF